jgi:hypothetical protein
MKLARMMIPAAALLAVLVTSTVYAGGCCGIAAGLASLAPGDLSKDQQKKVADLRTEFLKKQEQLRAEMGKKRIELMELAQKESPDEQAIQKKKQEIWSLQDAMRNQARTFGTKFRALLTPEQRQKLGPGPGMGCPGWGGLRFGRGAGCPGCPWNTSRL